MPVKGQEASMEEYLHVSVCFGEIQTACNTSTSNVGSRTKSLGPVCLQMELAALPITKPSLLIHVARLNCPDKSSVT